VIASGGIFDADSAQEKFQAGAQLIQLYTGFVYRGPQLLSEIMQVIQSGAAAPQSKTQSF
jgi:dihydroorotate dehydrogenase